MLTINIKMNMNLNMLKCIRDIYKIKQFFKTYFQSQYFDMENLKILTVSYVT